MLRDFLTGVSYLPRGFKLLWEPKLRRYVALPIAINVLVFALLFWLGAAQFGELIDWLLPDPQQFAGDAWWERSLRFLLSIAYWLLWPVFVVASLLVMFYTFTIVANLIGSPFNGALAARVEEHVRGERPLGVERPLHKEIAVSVSTEARKYAYFAKLALPVLLVFLIPGVNLIAPLLWALFGAWAIAVEYLDYPMANHGLQFKQERELLRRRRALSLGFGFSVLAMTLIPGLNLLAMPTGVIAATLLWLREWQPVRTA